MEISKILILSTVHLHPLEAQKIDKVAYTSSATCSMVDTSPDMYDYYINDGLPCLVDFLKSVKQLYADVAYVLFDADANVEDAFRKYDW